MHQAFVIRKDSEGQQMFTRSGVIDFRVRKSQNYKHARVNRFFIYKY